MNYFVKDKRSPKLSLDFNWKSKKNHIFFSTLVFGSKLLIKKEKKLSPTLKKIQRNKNHIMIKNHPISNKSTEDFDINDDKSTSNLTSTLISIEPNPIKQNLINHINTENNINIPKRKRKSLHLPTNSLTQTYKAINYNMKLINSNNDNDNNNKELKKRCRHMQVKREICKNNRNNPNNNNKDNKLENTSKLIDCNVNSREYKNKSITIPINKKINNNFLKHQKQDKSLPDYFFLKNKMQKKVIKNNIIENYKENKENIEINDSKNICYIKRSKINSRVKRIKFPQSNNICNSKMNPIIKYTNNGKKIGNKYYKIALKEIQKKENEIKDNNDIYFNENDLNENILSIKTDKNFEQNNRDSIINKVLHFKTECNGIFNQVKKNNNHNLSNNPSNLKGIHNNKKLKEKKESCDSVMNSINVKKNKEINVEENPDIKNIENIIKNNLDYNLNKKKFFNRKNDDNSYLYKLQKYNTHSTLNSDAKTKHDTNQKDKDENININQDYFFLDNNKNINSNSLTINRDLIIIQKRFKSISLNLNMQTKKPKHLINNNNKNHFYELLKNDKILRMFLFFCELDNSLLNKFCLISKDIYKKIKPFIYQKISSTIFKYNENNSTRNKIKQYLMKNNSSLMKLSPAILHKKYTDLIFENNNKYDTDIKKDLTRTFPNNILFKYGNTYYNKLYHILTAYSNFNKNIGYIQGLNFLAANIIYFFEDEIDEFVFLDGIIHKFDLHKILDKNFNNNFFVKKLEKINLLLMKRLPKLNKFLSNIKLNFEFFTTNWILTLFSDSMDNEYLTIIWDYMTIFGWKFFEYFILNILILSENSILHLTQNILTSFKKNILRNENFKKNFHKLINETLQSLVNDEIIV